MLVTRWHTAYGQNNKLIVTKGSKGRLDTQELRREASYLLSGPDCSKTTGCGIGLLERLSTYVATSFIFKAATGRKLSTS
jgi:hypothetical protein